MVATRSVPPGVPEAGIILAARSTAAEARPGPAWPTSVASAGTVSPRAAARRSTERRLSRPCCHSSSSESTAVAVERMAQLDDRDMISSSVNTDGTT